MSAALLVASLGGPSAHAGLVGYWNFDEGSGTTVADRSFNGLHGTVSGATFVNGVFNTGLAFDGDDMVNVIGNSLLGMGGSNQYSVNLWANLSGTGTGVCCGPLVGFRDETGWVLRYDLRDANPLEFLPTANGGYLGDSGGVNPSLNEWHMLTAVVDVNQFHIYVDGVLGYSSGYFGATTGGSTGALRMGLAGDGGFIGILDEVRVYDHALNAAEVQALLELSSPASLLLVFAGLLGLRLMSRRRSLPAHGVPPAEKSSRGC